MHAELIGRYDLHPIILSAVEKGRKADFKSSPCRHVALIAASAGDAVALTLRPVDL